MRILMFTGKGGVGKTSVSAATALSTAERGLRTMVLSTDPAHSLADSFDIPISNEPTLLTPNLWAQEVDLLHQMELHWGTVQEYLSAVMVWRGMNDLVAEETSVLPGMEELASLMQINDLAKSGLYDVVVVDCAPTGATLQLLAFPELARWYLDKIIPFQRTALKVAGPMIRRMMEAPLPDEELFASAENLVVQLEEMSKLLGDAQVTSMRLVLNPEKMVVKEAQRALTYLSLYGYATDLVVCNRMIPASVTEGYFANWQRDSDPPPTGGGGRLHSLADLRRALLRDRSGGCGDVAADGAGPVRRQRPQRAAFQRQGPGSSESQRRLSVDPAVALRRKIGHQADPLHARRADRTHRQLEAQHRPAAHPGWSAGVRRSLRGAKSGRLLPGRRCARRQRQCSGT